LDAATARVMRRFQLLSLLVDAVQICDQIMGQLEPGGGDRAVDGQVVKDLNRLCGRQLPGEAARDQVAEDRVHPADQLGARTAQVMVAARPEFHYGGVVFGNHRSCCVGAKGGHGDRAGVVGIVLVVLPGVEQTHPGGELGLHV
jgi:hypothetical protein